MEKTKSKKSNRTKEIPPKKRKDVVVHTVLRKSFFDTDNYWFYYTEVRKE